MSDYMPVSTASSPVNSAVNELTYQHAVNLAQTADISITTAEGDKVSISNTYETLRNMEYAWQISPSGRQETLTSRNLSASGFSLSVDGDLNEEELADIKQLLKDLRGIGRQFFAGNMETAMTSALSLNKAGSIQEFSASFTYNYQENTLLSEKAPVSAAGLMNEEAFPGVKDFVQKDSEGLPNYTDMLRGQWQQIRNLIDGEKDREANSIGKTGKMKKQLHHNHAAENMKKDHNPMHAAEKMMKRTIETLEQHPRLSPLAPAIVSNVIDSMTEDMPSVPALKELTEQLQNSFAGQFKSWLISI